LDDGKGDENGILVFEGILPAHAWDEVGRLLANADRSESAVTAKPKISLK
jgi:hypothetical protein